MALRRIVGVVVIGCWSSFALAAENDQPHFYGGIQVGLAHVSVGQPVIVDPAVVPVGYDEDSGALALKFVVGCVQSENVAVELALSSVAAMSTRISYHNATSDVYGVGIVDDAPFGMTLSAVLGRDVTMCLRLHARFGVCVALPNRNLSVKSSGGVWSIEDWPETCLTGGLGADLAIGDEWVIRAEAEYVNAADDYYMVSVGGLYGF